jgi:hypothetical protein
MMRLILTQGVIRSHADCYLPSGTERSTCQVRRGAPRLDMIEEALSLSAERDMDLHITKESSDDCIHEGTPSIRILHSNN